MRYVKWIIVSLIIAILTSSVISDHLSGELHPGDKAPAFIIKTSSDQTAPFSLNELKGEYVLLSFWASYDAPSRINNLRLCRAVNGISPSKLAIVSVSFDSYVSVFDEIVRRDGIHTPMCFVETRGKNSPLFRKYGLKYGFTNYLLNKDGVVVAKNISEKDLLARFD
jgi:hypothetical protein